MSVQTELLEIRICVGWNSCVNPWAQLQPVEVGGATVSNVMLHNEWGYQPHGYPQGLHRPTVERVGDANA